MSWISLFLDKKRLKEYLDMKATVVIPVIKKGEIYTISATKDLWNQIQVYFLKGAIHERIVIEFDITEEKTTKK